MDKIAVYVKLTKEEWDELKDLAKERGTSRPEAVRYAIKWMIKYLRENELFKED
jgi:metal-responsive CopG/Arc/MetJ family transcriptional regulator